MKVNPKLEKISPLWYGKIKEKKNSSELLEDCVREGKQLVLALPHRCIVGEAWKFKAVYELCQKCEDYSMDLYFLINKEFPHISKTHHKTFNVCLNGFIKHFNEAHN